MTCPRSNNYILSFFFHITNYLHNLSEWTKITFGRSTTARTHRTRVAARHNVTLALTSSKVFILLQPRASWCRRIVIDALIGKNIMPRTMQISSPNNAVLFILTSLATGASGKFICLVL